MLVEERSLSFQGPLPPPAILEHYNRIVPGAAERILKMAENQSNHRQTLERRVINAGTITSIIGQISALLVAFLAFAFAGESIKQGHSVEAVTAVITTITGLVSVFVYGRRQQSKQLRERAQ